LKKSDSRKPLVTFKEYLNILPPLFLQYSQTRNSVNSKNIILQATLNYIENRPNIQKITVLNYKGGDYDSLVLCSPISGAYRFFGQCLHPERDFQDHQFGSLYAGILGTFGQDQHQAKDRTKGILPEKNPGIGAADSGADSHPVFAPEDEGGSVINPGFSSLRQ
jgi:hypothetical protein